MSLLADFKARYTQFDSAQVDVAWPAIDPAYLCYYGVEYGSGSSCDDETILVLCAHLFTLQGASSNSPRLAETSKSVGSVSVSYGAGEFDSFNSFFMSSRYGQQFLQMTSSQAQGAVFI